MSKENVKKEPKKSSAIVPVVFTFNDNYSMAAGVAIYSLLKNSNKNLCYKIYVLHNDISDNNIKRLITIVDMFKNAQLFFLTPSHDFSKIWDKLITKDYYSRECLNKLVLENIFPKYDKIIVSDVDVVFKADISGALDLVKNDQFLSGYRPPGKVLKLYDNSEGISETIRKKLKEGIGAGFMVYNLKLMRENNTQAKLLNALNKYQGVLIQPEQDIINIALHGKIGYLPLEYCLCTYFYNLYRDANSYDFNPRGHVWDYLLKKYRRNLNYDNNYSKEELLKALKNPIQIHYASDCKPWDYVFTKRKLDWLRFLIKTPYLCSYLINVLKGRQKDLQKVTENNNI